jgi:hypothetical protein
MCAFAFGPKARAQCVSSARWDLCGGPPVRAVPTAIRRVPTLPCRLATARGSAPSGGNREVLSTDAGRAGGLTRSSEEASVMEVERRGQAIQVHLVDQLAPSREESG